MNGSIGVTGSMGCGKSYVCEQLLTIASAQGIEMDYVNVDSVRRSVHGNYSSYSHVVEKALRQEVDQKSGLVLVEWAMLVEDGLLPLVDNNVLLVKCSYDKQMGRLLGGDLPPSEIERRINAQLSNDVKEQRVRDAQKIGGGQLYVFDTTHNPTQKQYGELLERMVSDLR